MLIPFSVKIYFLFRTTYFYLIQDSFFFLFWLFNSSLFAHEYFNMKYFYLKKYNKFTGFFMLCLVYNYLVKDKKKVKRNLRRHIEINLIATEIYFEKK